MRFSSVASLCTLAITAFLIMPTQLGATSALSHSDFIDAARTVSLLTEAKCEMIKGHWTCKKNKHQSDNDDDDHKGKDKDKKETKTAKLIKQQDTCRVTTPGMGGGGCTSPLVNRCDKLKDGDQVCCCYKVDTSE